MRHAFVILAALVVAFMAGCTTTTHPDGTIVRGPDWDGIVAVVNAFGGLTAEIGEQYGEEIKNAVDARLAEWAAENAEDRERALRDEEFRRELLLRLTDEAFEALGRDKPTNGTAGDNANSRR